jgi:hypothetical protein
MLGGVVVLAPHLGVFTLVEAAAKVEHSVHCAASDQGGVRGSLSSELDGSVGAAGAAGAQESPGIVVAARRAAATCGDNRTPTQPKVPEAKIRGSQEGFQWVILGLERVPGVLKGVQRGPMGPLGRP